MRDSEFGFEIEFDNCDLIEDIELRKLKFLQACPALPHLSCVCMQSTFHRVSAPWAWGMHCGCYSFAGESVCKG